jgi:hypothetical protein
MQITSLRRQSAAAASVGLWPLEGAVSDDADGVVEFGRCETGAKRHTT